MKQLAEEIIRGRRIQKDDASRFLTADLAELCAGADLLRQHFCGNRASLCGIVNGRSGRCPENCKFCAQSAHHCTDVAEYDFLDAEQILTACQYHAQRGVDRFAIVTAGRTVRGRDFEKTLAAYRLLRAQTSMELCASHGLLEPEQFAALKAAGVTRYHANLETSRRYFPQICTTHTFDDKLECIRRAQAAGLEVCSGGILGLGETWEDRIDMALTLAELGVRSVPLNALIPISGTPLEQQTPLTEPDILRTVAMFRYILPEADIRLAAGRNLMAHCGRQAFRSGANATITGDMLTTSGNQIADDLVMLRSLGFQCGTMQHA